LFRIEHRPLILAVLSDKQKGLPEAVAAVLPDARHHFCHSHYLNNLAEPLAEADSAFNVRLRQAVRRWLDAQERVDNVPLQAEVAVWLQAYTDEHYRPEPKKRQRPASFLGPGRRDPGAHDG
ncbi:DUF3305 domain-containing protein, partial [Caldimonas sp.]|uniref:DUF3305 domain-containing protein n=1 Tax=Caldimonas sp. TaxID=2838790 RepID=UPI00391DD087